MGRRKTDGRGILAGCLCALSCETLFGLSYIFTKRATQTASAFALLGWRYLIALIAMGACIALGVVKVRLRGRRVTPLLAVALVNPVIYFIAETLGISRLTASESGAFLACIPAVSLAASALILRKKPTRNQVGGILITLAGALATVFAAGMTVSFSPGGYVMLSAAVVSYALYSVFVERAEAYSEAEITFFMLLAGAAAFVSLALAEAAANGSVRELVCLPFADAGFLTAVLYQGICCSVLAFFLSNAAIARIGVNRTSSFIGISTVVSILAGVLFLGECFSAAQLIGAAVILAGVYLANRA